MKKSDKNEKLNTESKPKKNIRKKTIILYSSIGVPLIAIGIVGGILLGQNVFKTDAYGDLDAGEINEDYTAVYNKYKKSKNVKVFEDFSPVEIANIAMLQLKEQENFYTISSGNVIAAGVKQTINATYIRNGSNYFEEDISESSFVKAANRFYEDDNAIQWYKGKLVSATAGDYSSTTAKDYSKEAFEEEWGRTTSRSCVYIVTDQTVESGEVVNNNDGTYTIDLNLDPTLSVLRYIKQMAMSGGLSQMPVFHSVNLKYVVDENVNLVKFITDEVYDVHMVIDAKNSRGQLTQEFFYKERTIPSVNEPTNYDK